MTTRTRIANDHLSVEISSLGAEMQFLKAADGRDFLWDGDAAFWAGRSPVLFPIVGKAPDNRIIIDGKAIEMGQHGFARRSEFILAASSETMCRYELAASDATRAVYPFEFMLSLEHGLDGPRLTIAAEVENRDTRPMPFGLGFHPAFRWPLPGADVSTPHTITLDNGAEPRLTRLDGGLVSLESVGSPFTSGRLTLDRSMFDDDAMIFAQGAGTGLVYAADDDTGLKFSFDNLPNLALWQKPGAAFICIEPWHGTAAEIGSSGEIEKRPYGTVLQPGEKARFAFTVEVRG